LKDAYFKLGSKFLTMGRGSSISGVKTVVCQTQSQKMCQFDEVQNRRLNVLLDSFNNSCKTSAHVLSASYSYRRFFHMFCLFSPHSTTTDEHNVKLYPWRSSCYLQTLVSDAMLQRCIVVQKYKLQIVPKIRSGKPEVQ